MIEKRKKRRALALRTAADVIRALIHERGTSDHKTQLAEDLESLALEVEETP